VPKTWRFSDDGRQSQGFGRMDGAPILSNPDCAEQGIHSSVWRFTQDFFNFIKGDRRFLAAFPRLARVAAYGGGFSVKVTGKCRRDRG